MQENLRKISYLSVNSSWNISCYSMALQVLITNRQDSVLTISAKQRFGMQLGA